MVPGCRQSRAALLFIYAAARLKRYCIPVATSIRVKFIFSKKTCLCHTEGASQPAGQCTGRCWRVLLFRNSLETFMLMKLGQMNECNSIYLNGNRHCAFKRMSLVSTPDCTASPATLVPVAVDYGLALICCCWP